MNMSRAAADMIMLGLEMQVIAFFFKLGAQRAYPYEFIEVISVTFARKVHLTRKLTQKSKNA